MKGVVDSGDQPCVDDVPIHMLVPIAKERQAMPEDGANARVDAIGRRYKLDNLGNRLYKGSGRLPWIKPQEWQAFHPDIKKRLTEEWKAKGTDVPPDGLAGASSSSSSGLVVPAMPSRIQDANAESESEEDGFIAPAMPTIVRCTGHKPRHRNKVPDYTLPFVACVARPVKATEIREIPRHKLQSQVQKAPVA